MLFDRLVRHIWRVIFSAQSLKSIPEAHSPDVSGLFVLGRKQWMNEEVQTNARQDKSSGEAAKSAFTGRLGRGNSVAAGGAGTAGRAETYCVVTNEDRY